MLSRADAAEWVRSELTPIRAAVPLGRPTLRFRQAVKFCARLSAPLRRVVGWRRIAPNEYDRAGERAATVADKTETEHLEDNEAEGTSEPVADAADVEAETRRVKFYSASDLSVGWEARRAAEVALAFDRAEGVAHVAEALELSNVIKFIELGLVPQSLSEEERSELSARVLTIRGAIARFFRSVEESNASCLLVGVPINYRADLLEELARQGAFERCSAASMLPALEKTGFVLRDLLESKALVKAYDAEVRSMLLADPLNGEHLVQKYLAAGTRTPIYLPSTFSPADAKTLMGRYVDSDDAHPNSLELIARTSDDTRAGIDRQVRFRARKRREEVVAQFFETNNGFKTGCEVQLDATQTVPATEALDGMVGKYSYSRVWLEETLDSPSILNNFQFLFDFADADGLLNLPSFYADLGVIERFMTTNGAKDYVTGVAFNLKDWSLTLQTAMYLQFLKSHDIDLESLLEWFINDYLPSELSVTGFRFQASSPTSSYLERCRHLFPEMEGLVRQFVLFIEDGVVDFDMLEISSEAVEYGDVPSALGGKYVYCVEGTDLVGVLNAVFSDQSGLTYIREDLQDVNFARLVVKNRLEMDDFHPHQLPGVNCLMDHGVLTIKEGRVALADEDRFLALHTLWAKEAVGYHHLSEVGRAYVDDLDSRGWVTRKATLLTEAEGRYFDYMLNRKFHNGPNLRNKYAHGAQPGGNEEAHFASYLAAIKLLIALAIKMNDEFRLLAAT